MADTTTHDTVGASTLVAPHFLLSPSSPSTSGHPQIASPDRLPSPVSSPGARSPSGSPPSSREVSLDRAARELDARLAHYTVDFSQFPSGHGPDDTIDGQQELEEETDRLSAVGGPEDFTANLERYLLGEDDSLDQEIDGKDDGPEHLQEDINEDADSSQSENEEQAKQQAVPQTQQPAVDDEAELGEYSEFGPPVDMSTPSHLLRRTAPTRDVSHLEDIEEDPDDEPSMAVTPSVRKTRSPVINDAQTANENLHRQMAELKQAINVRDEQLDNDRQHVLEAGSIGEGIKHLRVELQRKTALVEELQGRQADTDVSQRSSVSALEFTALQKQISEMQKDLQGRNLNSDIDTERLETIALLRQQLTLIHRQLQKRDAILDETLAQLKDVTAAKELQLHEKNAEIDNLRSQVEGQRVEIDKLETSVSRAHHEYRILEDQLVLLETKNRPLEEKNSTLEADLTRAQSQVTAQETALKAMAADLPLDTPGGTYSEILELIENLGQPNTSRPSKPKDSGDHDFEQIYEELTKLRTEAGERAAANKSLKTQISRAHDQTAESQLLIQSIEAANARLTKRTEELKSTLDQTQTDLDRLRTERAEAQETIDRLQDTRPQPHTQQQQLCPPSTPHASAQSNTSALESAHAGELTTLETAHTATLSTLSTLRKAHADSTLRLRSLLSASEKREVDLRAELDQLNQSQSHRINTDIQIADLKAENSHLNSVIRAKDEIAAVMDLRIAKSVEKREREWERRVELLLKEREKMGRALLWSWGEKEVGAPSSGTGGEDRREKGGGNADKENLDEDKAADGDKRKRQQGYRYKYVKRT
ncbi:hypothetical protein BJX70DRAFT_383151 [Aspergillus crustosus]